MVTDAPRTGDIDVVARRRSLRGRLLVLAGIVLIALNLRTAVAAVSPIVDRIAVDLPLDPLVIGLIGASPPLAFALSGVLAPLLARAMGLVGALLGAVGVMILGHLGRSLAPETAVLVVATIATLLGVGIANVLLPPLVKRYFPDRVGALTAVYATIMSVGAAVPALVAVPIADAVGWRASLGVWFLSSLLVAVPWIVVLSRSRSADRAAASVEIMPVVPTRVRLVRSPIAWAITGVFAATSIHVYSAFAWFPLLLSDIAGVRPADAGALLALYTITGFPSAIVVPVLAARLRSPVPIIVVGLVFFVTGGLGLLVAPTAAPALWMLLTGLGPLVFPLALVLIGLRTRDAATAVGLSGFVQGIGYLAGAVGTFLVGVIHAGTGGWTASLIFLLATLLLASPALVILGRPGTVEEESSARRSSSR